ncbi:HAD family hydrolase [Qipengyuania sp. MTN3-11]
MEAGFACAELAAPDRNTIRRMVGLSLPQALLRLAPDASEDRRAVAVQGYKDSFFAARSEGRLREPLFDGMAALLERLHAEGWLLAVATGKSDRGLAACLATHGIADYFISLQTADRHPSKPDPAMLEAALFEAGASPGEAVMVGDTVFDIAMARAAGVRAIGVAWGYHEPDELRDAGAEAVAETMEELEEMIRG